MKFIKNITQIAIYKSVLKIKSKDFNYYPGITLDTNINNNINQDIIAIFDTMDQAFAYLDTLNCNIINYPNNRYIVTEYYTGCYDEDDDNCDININILDYAPLENEDRKVFPENEYKYEYLQSIKELNSINLLDFDIYLLALRNITDNYCELVYDYYK